MFISQQLNSVDLALTVVSRTYPSGSLGISLNKNQVNNEVRPVTMSVNLRIIFLYPDYTAVCVTLIDFEFRNGLYVNHYKFLLDNRIEK